MTVFNFNRKAQLISGPPQFLGYDWVDIINWRSVTPPTPAPALPWIERVHTELRSWYGHTKIKAAD
jgi:hypothetical protein